MVSFQRITLSFLLVSGALFAYLIPPCETYSCTLLIDGDRVEKLNTKTDQTLSPLVYPSWHPSGKYVAFSVNKTKQAFHMNDRNRVEVFDSASDVVVYDT